MLYRCGRLAVEREVLVTYWWVNQGKTYQAERSAGILWAPQQTARGRALGHWTAMIHVQSGDIVLHYARGAIRALGRAEAPAFAADRPYGLPEVWESPGWMIRIGYFDLSQPIGRDELPMAWRLTEAPFDRHGKVKQGYLYPVSEAFAAELLDAFSDRWPPRGTQQWRHTRHRPPRQPRDGRRSARPTRP
jgi:hypothetical protein